jgi:phosphatidylglycerophosphate synthase
MSPVPPFLSTAAGSPAKTLSMFDRYIYAAIAPLCESVARPLAKSGLTADQITIGAFLIGISALPLLAFGYNGWALAAILVNRLLDALDGALARITKATDRGAFLDITLDFMVYGAVPLGFAIANPLSNALPASCLLFSFIGTGASFLAFSIIAQRRGLTAPHFPHKGIVYLAGLAEGFETIVCFVLICLWPQHFAPIAYLFSALCLLTTAIRLIAGWRAFSEHA